MIELNNVSFQYTKQAFMENLSLSFEEGKITSIIGPNGSGKSTLLMLMARILQPQEGKISMCNKEISEYTLKQFAQQVAVVHQKNSVHQDVDVETIIGYGRLPYLHYYQQMREIDYEMIEWAMKVTGLTHLRKQTLKTLSGGQQQRVWIAMALAQKTPILLLDEPTTYLDVKYQLEILNLIKKINIELKMTIIMVHHDIHQAVQFSDQIVAMKEGSIYFSGYVNEVVSETSLKTLYGCNFEIMEREEGKVILPTP